MKSCTSFILLGAALCGWFINLNSAFGQGTAFSYQGSLSAGGQPLTGSFDMQFKLHPASTGTNQVGSTLTNTAVGVANGLFTVTLDFSASPFTGNPLWLEIGVRTNGSTNAYDILSPTQPITSTPYAIRSLTAGTSAVFTGTLQDNQLSTNVPLLNGTNIFGGHVTLSNATGAFSGTFNGSGSLSGTFNGTGTGTFIGNGGGLTNLNVTNIVGVVQANPNWQLVQGTSQQAASANNYLATNQSLTTLTLPASPGVGDTLRISGSGVSGWKLAQNAGQSINTIALGLPSGKTWSNQPSTPNTTWRSLASSSTGINLVGAANNGFLYTSTNAGQSWQQRATSLAWLGVASSADGTHLAAVINNGFIAISQDSGATWTNHASSLAWVSVAASADGTKFAAVVNNGFIYTSTDSGSNWTQRASSQPWYSIASSADGTKLVAVANNASVFTSTDSGVTWSNRNLTKPWYSVASSTDGTKLVAVANNDYIYTSGDSGASWTQRTTSLGTLPFVAVSSSGDGTYLVAVAFVGVIYVSTDSGQTWTARTSGNQPWTAVCVSTDSTRAAAAPNGGTVSISQSLTSLGTGGSLLGSQYSNIELQHVGNGVWIPLSFAGTFTGN